MQALLLLALFGAIVGILIIGDADIGLYLSSDPPAQAFAQQVVWIIGASSGIGAGLAIEYAKSGAQIILSARREPQLRELASQCAAVGPEPLVLPLDVTDHSSHASAVQSVLDRYGHIDTLVLNAGQSQRNLAVETPFEVTKKIMDLNFLSLVALNKEVLPHMIKRKQGHIVVMSSISGLLGTPVGSSYSASKFALAS
jgi:short-subunit dehydrogenase